MARHRDSAGESTQERILRVAAEIFARKGYHATGVAELGAAAGLQRGALYYHIKSKEDLLYDLSKRHVEEALERGRAVLALDVGPVEKLRALACEHLRTIAARCAEVTVVIREMHALTGKRAKQLTALRDEYENLFAEVLREGVAQGVFASADRVVVLGVLGMFNWTHVWLDTEKGPLSPDDIADRLTDLVIQGQLRVPTPAPATHAPAAAAEPATAGVPCL
ncbi:TetR/AcrR family transcriptional regulator [Amycolatopsis sp. FDAARGOS 1241]|uniref:TetR/AcrR family transcriptional regulator n=1 Tax=Amycolatopsis sp. FDAARGOS 1241 TaxID=2778070 RepID=UPI001951D508|nr:TetR/AcrR family transcriptional regulator [Amycolatopsis sp. FDAARGOS 1241]QRP43201.1 TetR family transcriptional regulator [Amycolatopsis sp. FDAARGOS 1241]